MSKENIEDSLKIRQKADFRQKQCLKKSKEKNNNSQ